MSVVAGIIILLLGAGLVFKSGGKDGARGVGLTTGLVLIGLGLFGIMKAAGAPEHIANIVTIAVILAGGWFGARNFGGLLNGLIAIVFILALALLFSLDPVRDGLQAFLDFVVTSSTEFSNATFQWLHR